MTCLIRRTDCAYCGRKMVRNTETHPTRDHVIPRSKGGRITVLCCLTCNQIKGDMMPDEWRLFRSENPEWWRLSHATRKIYERRRTRDSGIVPECVPPDYPNDSAMQSAYEAVYNGRLRLLRILPGGGA